MCEPDPESVCRSTILLCVCFVGITVIRTVCFRVASLVLLLFFSLVVFVLLWKASDVLKLLIFVQSIVMGEHYHSSPKAVHLINIQNFGSNYNCITYYTIQY